jgi:ankyrin repeat protein
MNSVSLIIGIVAAATCASLSHASGADPALLNADSIAILRRGDAHELQNALDRGLSPNAHDEHGETPLMYAGVYGNADCVRLLIKRGADVNATNSAGATPLLRSATDLAKTALLVESGADVNARSALGNSPLLLAARPANSHGAVELLLNHGATVNATNIGGATPLMAAVAGGDEATVRLLLKHGADVNAQTAFAVPGFLFGGGRTALMWAAYRGDTALIKVLLDAGANVNAEGMLGTPLGQAAWADHADAAGLLLARGADVNQTTHAEGFSALHWAAAAENNNSTLVKLLLERGADPNLGGAQNVDAYMDVLQTPLMLARRRGDSEIVKVLLASGATNETPDRPKTLPPRARSPVSRSNPLLVRSAIHRAVPLLQTTALESKKEFARHSSRQDCVSCHQQFLPLAAISSARKYQIEVDRAAEQELVEMISQGELKNPEVDWEAVFHPDPAQTKGYALFGMAAADITASPAIDSWVHHLTVIQDKNGRWHNNLPRPPIQTSDVGPTALAIQALQRYPLPGRQAEFAGRVASARKWLWTVKPRNQEERAYQLLGLAWAGEPARKLQPLAKALIAQQRKDGGWAQLATLSSDAYATGQALYALRVGAGLSATHPAVERAKCYLLETQLADGSWYVKRRAFPFQPTMKSGFPHGRDSWISAAATSWAVMALSLPDTVQTFAAGR